MPRCSFAVSDVLSDSRCKAALSFSGSLCTTNDVSSVVGTDDSVEALLLTVVHAGICTGSCCISTGCSALRVKVSSSLARCVL